MLRPTDAAPTVKYGQGKQWNHREPLVNPVVSRWIASEPRCAQVRFDEYRTYGFGRRRRPRLVTPRERRAAAMHTVGAASQRVKHGHR